jgi:hypothetical protein
MKKEIGKWLMDVSKYMVTALFITDWFSDIHEWSTGGYLLGLAVVAIIFFLGVFLVDDAKVPSKKKTNLRSNYNKRNRR